MDRRSWPWKRKSSDKAAIEKADAASAAVPSSPDALLSDQGKQDNYKKPNYVQISVESYTHLTGLEGQVKSYEEQVKTLEGEVKELNEKLCTTQSEITTKESLVKQHAKVAEEAVSGWEKAEAEASALKSHLESVMLLKLTAEDRASHLDGALKECMRQIRNLKEEHEQKLHEVVLNKTKQWEKIKNELEAKIADLDQELRRSAAENAALSRSLQERSNMLVMMSEEKSQAEGEIELLKSNIESCEKEINSLKYELHVVSKELEIRTEEKNMSVRSAEVTNKQYLEGVRKIAKLEAECQRLRGLVRKKLPGPAALAQMKLEVENLGRDSGEARYRRSPAKPPSPHLSLLPEFSLEGVQKYLKENELLTERLWAMEEETKMLKEALAKRNSELQASRNICAKTVSKVQNLEAQLHANGDQRSPPKSNVQILTEGSFSQSASNPPSLTSMSEDGNDDEVSFTGSWSTALISELSHFKKEKNIESPNANNLELMDDFLEMEKLAKLSNSNGTISTLNIPNNMQSEIVHSDAPVEAITETNFPSKEHSESDILQTQRFPEGELEHNPVRDVDPLPLKRLQSKIDMVFESMSNDGDMDKILENIRQVVHDIYDGLHKQPINCVPEATLSSDTPRDCQACLEDTEVATEKEISLSQDIEPCAKTLDTISQELVDSLSQIHDFVLFWGKEAQAVQGTSCDGNEISHKLEGFSLTFDEVIHGRLSLIDFIHGLCHVLAKPSELRFSIRDYKHAETENASSDCIDKVALPENKGVHDSLHEQYPNACADLSDSTSDPDIPHRGNFVPTSGSTETSWKCLLEEFEQMKLEKENMAMDLERCTENLESTKSQLNETEHLLSEIKSELTSAKKLNSLAETQLKCMAESYKTLEARAEELQGEVSLLRTKAENLDGELQEEKRNHQDALSRCKDLLGQLQRIESCSAGDNDTRSNQERELAAAAEKLAECQEVIHLLGKQLTALRPQTELTGSPHSERSLKGEGFAEEEPTTSGTNLGDIDQTEMMDTATSTNLQRASAVSPMDLYNSSLSPSDSEANTLRSAINSEHPKHQHTNSGSSSSSSAPTPEKHSRGFSRFFSSKGKTGH